jgi:hypothetical protein
VNVREVIAVDLGVESTWVVIGRFNGGWLLNDVNRFLARPHGPTNTRNTCEGLLLGVRSVIAIFGQATSCRGGFLGRTAGWRELRHGQA